MHIDIKETIWTRYYITDKTEKQVKEALEEGLYPWDISEDVETDIMFDTSEVMSLEENNGNSTIEFYNEKGEIIYQNGK
jgi:hypothetical protein